MYGIEIVTPPASAPVAAAKLRVRLRLNDPAEDEDLTDFIAAAAELFEHDTGRPVLATTYRQHLSRWPWGPAVPLGPAPYGPWPSACLVEPALLGCPSGEIVLGRGGVTAVAGVYRTLADGSAEALAGWAPDLKTPPARVRLGSAPAPVVTAAGVPVTPVGYVEFTAGWADASAVPPLARTAIMLLAAHYYEHREAFESGTLTELPAGWGRLVARYKTGVSGAWGQ